MAWAIYSHAWVQWAGMAWTQTGLFLLSHHQMRREYLIQGRGGWQDSLKGKVRFVLPLAPTVTVSELENHASATSNALISRFHWADGKFIGNQEVKMAMESGGARSEHFKGKALGQLLTQGQVPIEIWQQFPPHSLYQGCALCLTTVWQFFLPSFLQYFTSLSIKGPRGVCIRNM